MSIYGAVHFRGPELAIKAFENRNVKSWALFTGKQFLASFNGATQDQASDALEQYLDLMNQPGNIAVYTLKVFEDLKPGDKIKSNTPDDGSFNFRLNDPPNEVAKVSGFSAGNYEMLQLLKKMDDRIQKLETEEGEPEPAPEKNVIGHIKEFLELPGIQTVLQALIQKVAGGSSPALGNAPAPAEAQSFDGSVNEYTDVIDAYNVIKNSGMPNALAMLQKLARIAQTDQEKFKSVQGAINMFL